MKPSTTPFTTFQANLLEVLDDISKKLDPTPAPEPNTEATEVNP